MTEQKELDTQRKEADEAINYRGNDSWVNPETGKACTNEVAYFSTARVSDMAGFPGWKGGK